MVWLKIKVVTRILKISSQMNAKNRNDLKKNKYTNIKKKDKNKKKLIEDFRSLEEELNK